MFCCVYLALGTVSKIVRCLKQIGCRTSRVLDLKVVGILDYDYFVAKVNLCMKLRVGDIIIFLLPSHGHIYLANPIEDHVIFLLPSLYFNYLLRNDLVEIKECDPCSHHTGVLWV